MGTVLLDTIKQVKLLAALVHHSDQKEQEGKTLCPSGSPLGDPGPLGDLFVDLGPLWVSFFVPRSPFSPF